MAKKLLFVITFISITIVIGIAGYSHFSKPKSALAAGNIINATSCEQADVQTAVNQAVDGDTVMVPAGSCVWNQSVVVTKGLHLKGSGIDITVLTNNIPAAIIGDYIIRYTPSNSQTDSYFELSGFTFDANNHGGSVSVMCTDNVYPCRNFRIHHNKLKNAATNGISSTGLAIRTKGNTFGLIDNNQFIDNVEDFKIYGNDDNSWNNYPSLENIGTNNYLYIEDNNSIGVKNIVIESGEGARWVYRYNTVDIAAIGSGDMIHDAHGNTQNRGVVSHEAYENNYINGYSGKLHDHRGGAAIVFNNRYALGGSCNGTIQIREEDCYQSKIDCAYPGQDTITNSYFWNNINSNQNKIVCMVEYDGAIANMIEENRDYWTDMDNWTLGGENPKNFFYDVTANRSNICFDDDSYWETDTKKLFRCDGTNNWIYVYSPYTYPHPLALDVSPPLPPTPLKGDFNSDQKVNNLDFTSFKNAFKSIFNSIFDLNSDNTIDVKDLGVLMNSWLP